MRGGGVTVGNQQGRGCVDWVVAARRGLHGMLHGPTCSRSAPSLGSVTHIQHTTCRRFEHCWPGLNL
jgi:hypothetical protein